MPQITYRHPSLNELLPACIVMDSSYRDLQARSGRKVPDPLIFTEPPAAVVHMHKTDYEGCWGAFEGRRMIGYGQALMRGRQWYLANLFVRSDNQNEGVGRELLRRCINYGRRRKADSFALCTFPYNEVALGLYTSFGLMPRYPIFQLRNTNTATSRLSSTGLRAEEGDFRDSVLRINRLEKEIRGYARLTDLRFFSRDPEYDILDFYHGRKWIGYSIIYKNTLIAPAGAIEPKYLTGILSESYRICIARGSKLIMVYSGGSNGHVYGHLKSLGFRIDNISIFVSDKLYGDFSRYMPAHLAIF